MDSDCEGLLLITKACPKDVWIAPKPKRITNTCYQVLSDKFLLDNEEIE